MLENKYKNIEIITYLESKIEKETLLDLLKKLNFKAIELVRTKEKIWIENYKNKNLSENEIIDAMIAHPKLIERPIIVKENKAIIARPADKINELLF